MRLEVWCPHPPRAAVWGQHCGVSLAPLAALPAPLPWNPGRDLVTGIHLKLLLSAEHIPTLGGRGESPGLSTQSPRGGHKCHRQPSTTPCRGGSVGWALPASHPISRTSRHAGNLSTPLLPTASTFISAGPSPCFCSHAPLSPHHSHPGHSSPLGKAPQWLHH